MQRRKFIQQTSFTAAALAINPFVKAHQVNTGFPIVRTPFAQRKFNSTSVEATITLIKKSIGNKELAWMFENCYPNTLDTTVDFEIINGQPDTYVITGDIDAMWLRDSTAQVTPYLNLCKQDKDLQMLIKGVINRQVKCILLDPYANAFFKDSTKISDWKDDKTDMKPGIHERKWEIDSLCYPIRLSYLYWKETNDNTIFTEDWYKAMLLVLQTFREQQRIENKGPYSFQRTTSWATDGVAIGGYGYPAKSNGLIYSMFRPSDDATIFPFLIPSNYFALQILDYLLEIGKLNYNYKVPDSLANKIYHQAQKLFETLQGVLKQEAIIKHTNYGTIYAYEVNGYGSYNLMDDANIPSLLAMPYLCPKFYNKEVYSNTRKILLSHENPFFFKGKVGEGIGGPHCGIDMIWPLSIIMRGLTSNDDNEIKACLKQLQTTHANTGFMHESFHKDDATNFTRKWFAWANTLFGEFILKVYKERKYLLG